MTVKDANLRRFILDRSAVPYFCNLVWFIRDQLVGINLLLSDFSSAGHIPKEVQNKIIAELDEQIDFFHYIMVMSFYSINFGSFHEVVDYRTFCVSVSQT